MGGLGGMLTGYFSNARRRARFQGLLTQKESPTAGRSSGSRSTPRMPRERRYDLQGHLQRVWHLQPYSNGKQDVGPVSDAMATKTEEIRRGICGRCGAAAGIQFPRLPDVLAICDEAARGVVSTAAL
jgi:hypothetical protein